MATRCPQQPPRLPYHYLIDEAFRPKGPATTAPEWTKGQDNQNTLVRLGPSTLLDSLQPPTNRPLWRHVSGVLHLFTKGDMTVSPFTGVYTVRQARACSENGLKTVVGVTPVDTVK
ncbi:hypothetical protein NEUTE1DRAFT_108533 [Neurospora tetrasperma FGSC 2508]|uniref:Uncharacterized protein n=1 Tax=Neurospora tetrasperma (strain FGSC 2508 / ATCC MYA-4615 / P0657) TaxID=510951 RepID=F8MIG8_NEUT8|nr:uncharacterized protein NEUTE1DRAFT_108533 [Neurospora tetrasperma FGSC 2508]EGO58972.1 hypothetical protein NEUTE1DRAFT_108533 [Neurospora tetrasperma FGSC 2508]EGZ73072.1 hypothetical protein NEUTE2DRAFT_137461 [Neurospora tetrasperma FGSC 2509]